MNVLTVNELNFKQELASLNERLNAKLLEIASLESTLSELNSQCELMCQTSTQQISELNERLNNKSNEAAALEVRVNELSNQCEAHQNEKDAFAIQSTDLNQQLMNITRTNEELLSQLSVEKSNAALHAQQVNDLTEKDQAK